MRIGVYPGSFDPLTNGHVGMLEASFRLVDRLIIAIGVHPAKKPLFSTRERMAMISDVAKPLAQSAGVAFEIATFDNLVVDFARGKKAGIIIRGLRDGTDLDYEMQMAGMNAGLAPAVQTVFLPASPSHRHITATLVRQIAAMGGDVTRFVPALVARRLAGKFS